MIKPHGNTLEILMTLCSYHPDRLERLTLIELAKDCQVTRQTAATHLKALRAWGYVHFERKANHHIEQITLTPVAISMGYKRIG